MAHPSRRSLRLLLRMKAADYRPREISRRRFRRGARRPGRRWPVRPWRKKVIGPRNRPGRGSRLSRRLRVQVAFPRSGNRLPRQPRILRPGSFFAHEAESLTGAPHEGEAQSRRRAADGNEGRRPRRIRTPASAPDPSGAPLAVGGGDEDIGIYSVIVKLAGLGRKWRSLHRPLKGVHSGRCVIRPATPRPLDESAPSVAIRLQARAARRLLRGETSA